MEKLKVTNWQLEYDGKKIPAQVPGDITIDLYKAGIIQDPYYGMNYVENTWVARTDFTYETFAVYQKIGFAFVDERKFIKVMKMQFVIIGAVATGKAVPKDKAILS